MRILGPLLPGPWPDGALAEVLGFFIAVRRVRTMGSSHVAWILRVVVLAAGSTGVFGVATGGAGI